MVLMSSNYVTVYVWRTVKGKSGMERSQKEAMKKAKETLEVAMCIPMTVPSKQAPTFYIREFRKTGVITMCPYEEKNGPFLWMTAVPSGYKPPVWNVEGGIEKDKMYGRETPWYALRSSSEMDEKANLYGPSTPGLVAPFTNRRVQAYALFMALTTLHTPEMMKKMKKHEENVIHFRDHDLLRMLICRVYYGSVLSTDRDAEKLMDIVYKRLVRHRVRLVYIPDFKKYAVTPPKELRHKQ